MGAYRGCGLTKSVGQPIIQVLECLEVPTKASKLEGFGPFGTFLQRALGKGPVLESRLRSYLDMSWGPNTIVFGRLGRSECPSRQRWQIPMGFRYATTNLSCRGATLAEMAIFRKYISFLMAKV